MDTERKCETCRYYLGDGCCRLDLEDECAAGGFEAWEPKGIEKQLAPCPFCGENVTIDEAKTMGWAILHKSIMSTCLLHLPIVIIGVEKEYAIAKWNRREPETTRRRLQVHNIGNVDIPDGVSEEDFHKVMNNVADALEHTERGESWPYETGCGEDFCEIGGGEA